MSTIGCFAAPTLVTVGGRDYEVRELAWPEALEFFRRLGGAVGSVLTPDGRPRPLAELVPEWIGHAEKAVAYLLLHSAGISTDSMRQLPAAAVLRLTQAALSLTLNDEVILAGNAVAGRLQRALGLNPTPAPPWVPSSTSLSATDTATRI